MELRRSVSHGVMQAIIGMGTQKVISIGLNRWAKRYNQKQLEAALKDVEVHPEKYGLGDEIAENVTKATGKLNAVVIAMKADFPRSWKFIKNDDEAFEVFDGVGNKWAMVYNDKIVAPGRTAIGTRGNPILNKATHVKNIKYDVDGIIYHTDDLGRVFITKADLDNVVRVRLGTQQVRAVDVKDGVRGTDQGGHIVATRFFGPGEQINLFPQSAKLNQKAWKQMENTWAEAVVKGSDVKIEVMAIFSGTSKRPSSFKVTYTINGQPFQENFINN